MLFVIEIWSIKVSRVDEVVRCFVPAKISPLLPSLVADASFGKDSCFEDSARRLYLGSA